MTIHRETWNRLTNSERVDLALEVRRSLPVPFAFSGIRTFQYQGQENSLAVFNYDNSEFVLIPGDTVRLGYEWERPFPLTSEQVELWEIALEEFETPMSFDDYLEEIMTPPRDVSLDAFLLETKIKRLVDQKLKGVAVDESAPFPHHARARAQLASQGLRLPTSDEWEYACGAGVRTLYRWGEDAPMDWSPSEDRGWLQSGPNAFGLTIANNPWQWEAIHEPGFRRGGDGGGMSCGGGMPYMLEWLLLATAYIDKDDFDRPVLGDDVRRALTVEL